LGGIPREGEGHAICEPTVTRKTDCAVCRTLKTELERLRDCLYQTLEAAGMDHGHPEVLRASVAFDALLNVYLRHRSTHGLRSVSFGQPASHSPPDRLEVAGR